MTVKDIVKIVCEFIGREDIIPNFAENKTFSESEQEVVDFLVRAFNLVNEEIAGEYLPFLMEEEVDINNSNLEFSNLTETVLAINKVEDAYGNRLEYKNFSNYIKVYGHAKKVIYSFLPEKLELGDNVVFFNGLSARIYAYGIASEYFLLKGESSEAQKFEDRFKQSLFVLSRRRGEHKLARRSFL